MLALTWPGAIGVEGTRVGVQDDRLFIQTNHRSQRFQRVFVYLQNIFHALDIGLIELRDAPHFFPATASDRGFGEALG